MLRAYTRVAVVQLAFHPAMLVQRRSPLSDPLFEIGRPDSRSPLGAWLDDPPFFDWIRRSADDHEGGTDSGSNVPR